MSSHKTPFRKPPYSNTTVPMEKTKAEIEILLKAYGVKGIQWTSIGNEEDLKFLMEVTVRGVRRELAFQVKPSQVQITKRVPGRGLVKTEDRNQEYRLLYWWIKSKLEAVYWGLSTIEKEFLSQVIVSLPNGPTTMGDVAQEAIAKGSVESLPFIQEKRALEKVNPKIIDAQ